MALIRTIQEVKKYLKVDATANSTATLPDMNTAERKYLVPVIGNTLYQLLQQAYTSDQVPGTRFAPLLDLAQAAVAPLAFLNDSAFINVRITEAGFRKTITADQAPIYKWDYTALINALQERGMDAIESLLAYLEVNKTTFPEWVNDPVYAAYTSCIIRNGSMFNQFYKCVFPRYCFLQLESIIRLVEDMYIKKTIGSAFTESLKMVFRTGTDTETELFRLLCTATANLTIFHAANRMGVEVTSKGFVVSIFDKDLHDGQRVTGDNNSIFKVAEEAERIGQAYLKDAVDFLNKNASEQLFPVYFQSSFYKAPGAAAKPSINSHLKGSFTL
jgi:hypothetical protein